VSDRLCVIVGGGAVAVRKANGLIKAGAQRVHMIAPAFSPEVPKTVQCIHDFYRPEYLDHAGLVFASTNLPDVNDAVVRDAHERGIWVGRADDAHECPGDFLTPARFEKGPITVAVSAGSAALSVMIRDQLALHWEPRWTAMAQAMMQLRPEIKAGWDETTRRNIFRDLATVEAMDVLANGGIDVLRHWIGQRHGVGI
jgi:precorrin-2 dehydrogenase / sirohydrochlorin ferrochelatase